MNVEDSDVCCDGGVDQPDSALLKRINDYEQMLDGSAKAYAELNGERDELHAELERTKAELSDARQRVAKCEVGY